MIQSNGFYGSKGLSRLIPEGYTYLESRFHRDAMKAGRSWDESTSSGVRLREWEREGWTYHSKGRRHISRPGDKLMSRYLDLTPRPFQPILHLRRILKPFQPILEI